MISVIPDAWGFIVIEVVQLILNGFEDVSQDTRINFCTCNIFSEIGQQ